MRGPIPQPTALKLLKGVRPNRINKSEPKPPAVTGVIPKGWALHMSDGAKRFWQKNAPVLARLGVLTEVDLEAFRTMAEIHAQIVQCNSVIKRRGVVYENDKGNPVTRPEANLLIKLEAQYREYSKQFGMVPGERSRLHAGGDTEAEADSDLD